MAAFVDFGDAEAAACDIVRAAAQVTAFAPVTISTDLVGYTASQRWVWLHRDGGEPTLFMRLDNPTIVFEIYAPTKATARDLAAAARGAMFAAQGTYTGRGLALYDVNETTGHGLKWKPDDLQPTVSRYTFALDLVTRPL